MDGLVLGVDFLGLEILQVGDDLLFHEALGFLHRIFPGV